MIFVIATIQVAESKRDEFLREFRRIVPLVRDEDGCLEYGPTVDVPTDIAAQIPLRNDVATIVEKWENLEALKVHLTAPHMLEYRQRVKDLVQSVTLQILEPA